MSVSFFKSFLVETLTGYALFDSSSTTFGYTSVAVGGFVVVSGVGIEIASCGAYTVSFGFQESIGLSLVAHGCSQVSYYGYDLFISGNNSNSSGNSNWVPYYEPGYTESYGSLVYQPVDLPVSYGVLHPLPLGVGEQYLPDDLCLEARSTRPLPDPHAQGSPHTIIERPGREGQYTTHNGDGTFKQYRGSGKPHGDIPRPNVKQNVLHDTPKGPRPGKSTVRPANIDEIPKA